MPQLETFSFFCYHNKPKHQETRGKTKIVFPLVSLTFSEHQIPSKTTQSDFIYLLVEERDSEDQQEAIE